MLNPGSLMLKTFFIALICICCYVNGADTPDASWDQAQKQYEEAQAKVRKGQNDEAIVVLRTAVETLKEIQYNYPKWNSSIVRNKLLSAQNRIDEVEELILSSLSGLNKEQLIERLKDTQIAKAKFSKAMMIIYNKLKDSQELLKLKTKDLDAAQQAASKKITDQAHLDKMSFENLKMKKSLEEKNAQIKVLQARLDNKNEDMGASLVQKEYEIKFIALSKKLQELEKTKNDLLKDKKRLIDENNGMKRKVTEISQKETSYEKNTTNLKNQIANLKKQLAEEEAMKKKVMSSSENVADQLELAAKRLIQLEKREKTLLTEIKSLKQGKTLPAKMADGEKISRLNKQINNLKKIEIDLKAKLGAAEADAVKNKQLLTSYMSETGPERKKVRELTDQVQSLKKAATTADQNAKIKNTQMVNLSREIVSLKDQLKLQQKIIGSLKERLKNNTKPEMAVVETKTPSKSDPKLLKAFEKNEKELVEKLKLAEQKVLKLQKRNEILKKENLLGDEEMIRKYVQVRDELKAYKERTKKFINSSPKAERQNGVMQAAFSEDEKRELERHTKLNDLLYRAQKAEKEEKFQASLGLYTEVLRLDPENYDALFRIGLIHYNRRHYQDASVHLKKAFYKEPDDENLLLALGLSYLEQNKIEMAVSYLSRLVGLKPDDALSRLQLGVSLQGLGWTEAAFDQLKRACELDNENGEAAFNLAMVSLALPEPKVALAKQYYDRAVKLGIVRDSQLEKYFQQYKEN